MQKTHSSEIFLPTDMKELEKYNFLKNKSYKFMKKAGYEAFKLIKNKYKKKQTAIVLCGPGNNGGDGFIVANYLLKEGYKTKVYTLFNNNRYSGDALLALKNFKGQIQRWYMFKAHSELEINLLNEMPQEFVEYKWATYWHSLASVVPFKRDVYRAVLTEFLPKYIQLNND